MYRAIQAAVAVAVVEEAAQGIQQAMDDWDAVNDGFCDESGNIVDHDGWNKRIVERDLTAYKHFTRILPYSAAFVFHMRLPVDTNPDDARLKSSRTELARANVSARRTLREIHNDIHPRPLQHAAAEVWHEMTLWAENAPALIDAHRRTSSARARAGHTTSRRATTPLPAARPPADPPGSAAPHRPSGRLR
ncbi:hypothetical protein AB0I39_07820 [Kitasatospora purpeofusca]|uniref:hypothetical protein n=1 Tax=Kitasatospora purpeofusca TaxID=67352 RepID=UPI00340EE66C